MRKWLWWIAQIGIAGVVAVMVWRALSGNWDQFRSLHVVLRPAWIALSTVMILAAYALQIQSWRRMLAGWAQHLSFRHAARIYLVVNLGRYVPGKLWSVTGLVVLAQQAGVDPLAAGASAFAMQALAIGTAVVVVAAGVPAAESPLRLAIAALAATGTIGVLAWGRSARWLAGLVRRVEPFGPLPIASLVESAGLMLASWLVYGIAFRLLVPGLGLQGALPLAMAAGVFALGCVLGLLALFAPGGVGVREVVFIGLLTPTLGGGGAVALSVGSRVLMTLCEIVAPLSVLLVTKRSKANTGVHMVQKTEGARKSHDELKALYGAEYVRNFQSQSPWRLGRLVPYFSLRPTDTVGDFGCGNGMLLDLIGDKVHQYIGVDFSEPFIRAARERARRRPSVAAEFVCSSVADFCASRPNSLNVAFAMDFSEHVYDDEWLAILRSIRSALKPGGRLYLHTPNAEYILEIMKARSFLLAPQPEHVAVRTPEENCRLLRDAGFSVERVRIIAHYKPILRSAHVLAALPGIGRYFGARLLIEASRPPSVHKAAS